jgi:hypothetical protein
MASNELSRLLILWTSGDKQTALNMVFMYTINAKLYSWWDEVVLLIWGSSDRLAAEDEEVQAQIAAARKAGVRVIACRRCAENLELVEALEKLDVEVFYTGQFLTDWLKSGDRILAL